MSDKRELIVDGYACGACGYNAGVTPFDAAEQARKLLKGGRQP